MRLIDADALKEQFEDTHRFYISAWGGDFSKMPIRDKAACDELVNCIAEVVNAPTINAVPREDYEALERHFVDWEPVVRCKDCTYYCPLDDSRPYDCLRSGMLCVRKEDFCSCGKEKR